MNSEKSNGQGSQSALKPHNKKMLANLLGVSNHILNQMIAQVFEQLGKPACGKTQYSAKQVEFLINTYLR